ncbi:MAG: methionyl-tRNA formyltransferase [Patescibacteria group bacterium]
MKYVFFGTPEFSKIVLQKLISANFIPLAVVTNPDRPSGRKRILTAPPAKLQITNNKLQIRILQPEKLDHQFIQEIKNLGVKMGVLAAYGKIVPQELIDVFPKGIIVVHPSLLPKYRGATPIQSAILAGEQETGTTLIVIDDKVDHGPVLAYSKWQIANGENYESLAKNLAELSGNLLIETLPKYYAGKIIPQPQNHHKATYTKKFIGEDGFVESDDLEIAIEKNTPPTLHEELRKGKAEEIWRKVRALNPEPGIYTIKNNRRMKILEADLIENKLVLKKIQFEGEKIKSLSG